MAVKGQTSVTVYDYTDVSNIRTWYKTVSRSSSAPTVSPTATESDMTSDGWTTTEPGVDTTKKLYTVQECIFGDGTYTWGSVSLSSSYEAAVEAYNLAYSANQSASSIQQHFWTDEDGAHVTEITQEEWGDSSSQDYHSGGNVLIDTDGLYVRDGTKILARFTKDIAVVGEQDSARTEISSEGVTIISPTKATAMEVSTSGVVSVVTMTEDLGWDSARQNDITYYDEYDYGLKISPSQLGTSEEITASYIFDVLDDANSNSSFDISVFCSLSNNRATGGGYGTPTYRYGVTKSFRKGTASVQTVRDEDATWDKIQIAYDGVKTITIKELSTKSNYRTSDNASSYGGDYTAIKSIAYKTNSYSPLIEFTGQIEETGDITVTGHVDAVDGFKINGAYIGSYCTVFGQDDKTVTLGNSSNPKFVPMYSGKARDSWIYQIYDGGVKCLKSGIYLVSGKVRLGSGYTASDIVTFQIYNATQNSAICTERHRVAPNQTAPNQSKTFTATTVGLSANDIIKIRAYNNTGARGTINNDSTYLYLMYLAPLLTERTLGGAI